jgi:hypothetical protein
MPQVDSRAAREAKSTKILGTGLALPQTHQIFDPHTVSSHDERTSGSSAGLEELRSGTKHDDATCVEGYGASQKDGVIIFDRWGAEHGTLKFMSTPHSMQLFAWNPAEIQSCVVDERNARNIWRSDLKLSRCMLKFWAAANENNRTSILSAKPAFNSGPITKALCRDSTMRQVHRSNICRLHHTLHVCIT